MFKTCVCWTNLPTKDSIPVLLLSSLWDRASKYHIEDKACSKVLSQPEWKPSQQMGTEKPSVCQGDIHIHMIIVD